MVGGGLWCFTAGGPATDQLEIIGSRGRVIFSYFDQAPVCLSIDGEEEQQYLYPRQDPIQLPLIRRIVAALRGEGDCPSTGESAARTNWVMEQIAGSAGG